METFRRIYWPAINLIGPGAVQEVGVEINKLALKKLLLVTDKVLRAVGIVNRVTDVLDKVGINYVIFDEIKPNPTTRNVTDGLQLYQEFECDIVRRE